MRERTNQELENMLRAREISFDEYQALLDKKRQSNREKQRRRKERLAEQRKTRNEDTLRLEERYSTTLCTAVKMILADYAKATGVPQGIIIERALIEYMSKYWPEGESVWVFYRPLPNEPIKPAAVCVGKKPVCLPIPKGKQRTQVG
ncbi:hypothetical protein LJC31_00755 [Synergistaceae bacterium OttesenSCG-928-I11]|nr:hypothetical protein [Synergistaceae bacterium OttesenSCG-928-I11]